MYDRTIHLFVLWVRIFRTIAANSILLIDSGRWMEIERHESCRATVACDVLHSHFTIIPFEQ